MVGTTSFEPIFLTTPMCLKRLLDRLDAKAELFVNELYHFDVSAPAQLVSIRIVLSVSTYWFASCV